MIPFLRHSTHLPHPSPDQQLLRGLLRVLNDGYASSTNKNTIALEHLLRSMCQLTGLFIDNTPFNLCNLLRSPLLLHFTDIGIKVLPSHVSGRGFEPWVSNSTSCVLSTLSCHYPLIIKLVLKFVRCVLKT